MFKTALFIQVLAFSAVLAAPAPKPAVARVRRATPTVVAPAATATVPLASDDPNEMLTGTTSASRGQLGGTVIGPNNLPLVYENEDLLAPPTTDEGDVKNVKWPFSLSHNRLQTGGWARQQNTDQLPTATDLAGVNMRLEPGAYRELHWHTAAEWAYMIKGGCRISTITPEGNVWVADVNQGDLWYFPPGNPHSIQALGPEDAADGDDSYDDGAEFLLVFDDGSFSEDGTFLLTDWLAHVPKSVIAKNFQQPQSNFDGIPGKELYIFPGYAPPQDVSESMVVPNDTPEPYTFAFSTMPVDQKPKGTIKIADSTNFKVAQTIAVAEITVEVGGMRELHWHPTQPEWAYYLEGQARMTVFASSSNAATYDFQAGDISYVQPSYGHYIENTGNTTLKFLEIFKSDRFQDISLQQWLALTPHDIVKAHLNISDETIAQFSTQKLEVV